MPIKPPSPRHTVQELENGIRVTLPSKKNAFRLVWFGLWLLVWGYMAGSIFYVWAVLIGVATGLLGDTSSDSNPAVLMSIVCILPFLIALLGVGGVVIYSFLWQIVGKEIIEANANLMTLTRQIFGWKKSGEYSSEMVRDLRVNPQQPSAFAPIRSFQKLVGQDGLIAFDYGAKTFRFGLEIDEAEAKQIVSVLQQRLPQQ